MLYTYMWSRMYVFEKVYIYAYNLAKTFHLGVCVVVSKSACPRVSYTKKNREEYFLF